MNKRNILIYVVVLIMFNGCGPSMASLNLKNEQKNYNYPILIPLSNNSTQTKFSKVVEFDNKKINDSAGELFIIEEGIHELEVKWAEIVGEATFLFYNNAIIPITYGDFLRPKKTYKIKENFEAGYTYMIDLGDRYRTNEIFIPKKLCLLRRKSTLDELKSYTNGTIFNNMKVVSCFEYDGELETNSFIAHWPW